MMQRMEAGKMAMENAPILDYAHYEQQSPELAHTYQRAEVFPHIVMDNFLVPQAIGQAIAGFPAMDHENWRHYVHYNERKKGITKRELIPQACGDIIDELNSPRFISLLENMTGIKGLIPDPGLEGGGIHQIDRGGFLNIHADFTAHPHHRLWRRRVNVLVYLNENWKEEYGGHLELWTKDMKNCFRNILPIANRCVIFSTDVDSYHGHPHPLACPEGMTRKSIALYYFTVEETPPLKVATNYQATPGDGLKSILIYLDKKLLVLYFTLKSRFGLSDDAAGRLMKFIERFRR